MNELERLNNAYGAMAKGLLLSKEKDEAGRRGRVPEGRYIDEPRWALLFSGTVLYADRAI